MKPVDFHALYRELIEENPLAIRAVLKVLAVEFTDSVPTLAVTCEARPRLLVNLGFLGKHCRTDFEVKAVICHEFLHVLLRHTERLGRLSYVEHLALDAVINAIIHRSLGPDYSAMMSRYYANERGPGRLLRPAREKERDSVALRRSSKSMTERTVLGAWECLYAGRLVADDIRDLARDLLRGKVKRSILLLGSDERGGAAAGEMQDELPAALTAALDQALKSMDGAGIFRSPTGRGFGAAAYRNAVPAVNAALEKWRQETCAVLRQHLLPDPLSPAREPAPAGFTLPVLSPGDRRAALRARWSPFLPEAVWRTEAPARAGSAHVYLDVSGSMNAEMPQIVGLLARLGAYIRRPFFAFSDVVAPARIEGGRLLAETTGGTSMSCVLEHLISMRPRAAVIVTDGYIEQVDPALVRAASGTRLHAIVSRNGSAAALQRAGIPCTQLSRLPT